MPHATVQLLDYCLTLKQGREPDPALVESCVANGADLSYEYPRLRSRTLHILLQYASSKCVAAAFKTVSAINFSTPCGCRSRMLSPLHLVVIRSDRYEAAHILGLIISRVQSHPEDFIDFSQKTWDGLGILSLSAKHRRLSLLWPYLKHLATFSQEKSPFIITVRVSWEDWKDLPDEDKTLFRLEKGIDCNPISTERLHHLCLRESESHVEEVVECIREGADVCSTVPEAHNSLVIQILLRKGWMKYIEACFETDNTIFFRESFFTLFRELNTIYIEKILALIINRVARHPGEEFSWDIFLNAVVRNDALSFWWTHLKKIPYFKMSGGKLPITSPMYWRDWCTLPLEDRPRFLLLGGVEWNTESTIRLESLLNSSGNLDRELIRECVSKGANAQARSRSGGRSLLEIAFSVMDIDFAIEILESVYAPDEGRLFNALCLNIEASELLKSLISFCLSHPSTLVGWAKLIPTAASLGLLHCFWPQLKVISYFSSFDSTFSLDKVWKFDWDHLVDTHQDKHFSLNSTTIWEGTKSTATLVRVLLSKSKDPLLVEKCVEKGVNLFFFHPWLGSTILSYIITETPITFFRAALNSPEPLDFTTVDNSGRTILHTICLLPDSAAPKEYLEALLERIELNPGDTVDFTQTTREGDDFLSLAACTKRVSLFWPIISSFPYFADKMQPIQVKQCVCLSDWSALSSTDRERLIFLEIYDS